jgi:hypothetical protein
MKVCKFLLAFVLVLGLAACKPPDQKKVLTVLDAAVVGVDVAGNVVAALHDAGDISSGNFVKISASVVRLRGSLVAVRAAVVAGKLTQELVAQLAAEAEEDLNLIGTLDSNPKLVPYLMGARMGILAAEVILQNYLGNNLSLRGVA